MQKFRIGDLTRWSEVAQGEMLEFKTETFRTVTLTLNTSSHAEVYVVDDNHKEQPILVCAGQGVMEVTYTAEGNSYLTVSTEGKTFYRGNAPSHTVKASETPSYTSVEPRERRNTDMHKLMHMVALREKARDRAHAQKMAELQAAQAGTDVVEPNEQPQQASPQTPTPDPEQNPEGGEHAS